MQLRDVLAALGMAEAEELFAPHWDESEAEFPADGPFFLAPDYVQEGMDFCAVDDLTQRAAVKVADTARPDPALSHLAWHCYRLTYVRREYPSASFAKWPFPERTFGDAAAVFYLLVGLGGLRIGREHDRKLGIPEEVTRLGWYDIAIGANRYRRFSHGKAGFMNRHLSWYRNHAAGGLYRMGRLQYIIRPYGGFVTAYRNQRTGDVVALSDPGLRFDAQGFRARPEAQPDGVQCWESALSSDETSVVGHPALPEGVVLRRPARLLKSAWNAVLVRGDRVLETHIPEGGGMTLDRCGAAMRQALDFFPRYFPESPFKGFCCHSWIMNPEFETFYSATANLVLYQKELYLYPYPWATTGGVFFVFDADSIDVKTAPRNTSLRRAMVEHLERGGILRNGGMFFLKEDMPKFGSQCYRGSRLSELLRAGDPAGKLAEYGIQPGAP